MATDFDYASPTVPPWAVVVAADEPLLVYPSVAAAEWHLEAIDVEDGLYSIAYGPNGEPFRVGSQGNRVLIEATGEPNRPDELRFLLVRYREAIGRAPDATATFDELVATVWAIESYLWQELDPFGDQFWTRVPMWRCSAFVVVVALVSYFALGWGSNVPSSEFGGPTA